MGNANAKAGKKGKAGESKGGESKTPTAAESKTTSAEGGAGARGAAAAGAPRRPSVVAQKSMEQKITKDDFIMLKTVGKGCVGAASRAPATRGVIDHL